MERYSAVTLYLLDWRTERAPSMVCWEDIVFWRDTGMNDDEEEVEAREGACSIATDIARRHDSAQTAALTRCSCGRFGNGSEAQDSTMLGLAIRSVV